MANTNWSNGGRLYIPQVKPVLLNCSFAVDSGNVNGLGISDLKGPGIQAVYMNTTQPPLGGNPNPAAGLIVVQLAQNFQRFLSCYTSISSPADGADVALNSGNLNAGDAYVITGLNTSTQANWETAGLVFGYTAAVGSTFICTAAGAAGIGLGLGTVQAFTAAGLYDIEVLGDPNQTIGGQTPAGPTGAQIILQVVGPTSNVDPTPVITAPADGSLISLSFYLSDSSITVNGQ